MADTIDTVKSNDGHRNVTIVRTCVSDSTGETNATFVDPATLSTANGVLPLSLRVDRIDYDIQGFTSVTLNFDATTDDELVKLGPGANSIDWSGIGGRSDPRTAGYSGKILITTAGATLGDTYTITLYCVKKY